VFEFETEKIDFLSAAKIWCVTGKLLSGEIRNNTEAFVETETGVKRIKIETVAFVDSMKPKNFRRLTLTVSGDEKILPKLTGKLIASAIGEPVVTV
jgi:hypothetical protein